jgi:hypothetical protein
MSQDEDGCQNSINKFGTKQAVLTTSGDSLGRNEEYTHRDEKQNGQAADP